MTDLEEAMKHLNDMATDQKNSGAPKAFGSIAALITDLQDRINNLEVQLSNYSSKESSEKEKKDVMKDVNF